MFVLQRITGVITLNFYSMACVGNKNCGCFGAEVNFDMMENIVSNPFMLWFYIIGIVSAVFHFANGLWSFFVSWGITVTPRSQQISTYVTIGYLCCSIYNWCSCNLGIRLIHYNNRSYIDIIRLLMD